MYKWLFIGHILADCNRVPLQVCVRDSGQIFPEGPEFLECLFSVSLSVTLTSSNSS